MSWTRYFVLRLETQFGSEIERGGVGATALCRLRFESSTHTRTDIHSTQMAKVTHWTANCCGTAIREAECLRLVTRRLLPD